jgi:hypothetical protein
LIGKVVVERLAVRLMLLTSKTAGLLCVFDLPSTSRIRNAVMRLRNMLNKYLIQLHLDVSEWHGYRIKIINQDRPC